MKLLKKMKKGFTLVELIVVIAVIATLAAVSVGVYFGVTDSAKKSNDQTVTNQMNKALLLDQTVNGQPKTPTDALDVLAKNGFVVTEMSPFQDGAYYLWDSVDNKMILINKEGEVDFPEDATIRANKDFEYFTFVRADNDKPANHNYSYYLKDEYVGNVNFTAGFDTGINSTLETTTYSNSNTEQDVIIRNNGESLTVNAPKDTTVEHYGTVKDLTIESVDSTDCYHEHGYVANFKTFGAGKFIAESTAQFHQTKAEVESVLNGKTYELSSSAQYGVHVYNPETGKCAYCDQIDPENPNVQPPVVEDEEVGIEGVNPQLKMYEEADGGLSLILDKSDMKEYADQVSYYLVEFSTKFVVKSEKMGFTEEYELKFTYDSRYESSIPYVGTSMLYPAHYLDEFPEEYNGIQFVIEDDPKNSFIPRKSVVEVASDSLAKKALIENVKGFTPQTKVFAVLKLITECDEYPDGYYVRYYTGLSDDQYEYLCKGGTTLENVKTFEAQNPDKVLGIEISNSLEDASCYTVKAYNSEDLLLGKTSYGNAYSQWKNGENVVEIPEEYKDHEFNCDKKITGALSRYSNTFNYYRYKLETRGSTTTFWTEKN